MTVPPENIAVHPSTLELLLECGTAFVNPGPLLEDISPELATQAFPNSHNIASIVWHMQYWQTWFFDNAEGRYRDYPKDNLETFNGDITQEEWGGVRDGFLERLATITALSQDVDFMNQAFTSGHPKTHENTHHRSKAEIMLYMVVLHNAHHYGQILSLRQQAGAWPPAAGGMTL